MARPKGSYTRPQIRDYIKDPDIKELTELAVKKAKEGDTIMHKFVLEQLYGKAIQPQEHSGDVNLKVEFDAPFKITQSTGEDSTS